MYSAITLNSRRHDLTSIEHYVDQSRRLFIHDVAKRQRHATNRPSSVDKASWSKMVHLRKVSGKCKYMVLKLRISKFLSRNLEKEQNTIRRFCKAKINICVFQVSTLKKLGMVGWHNILFCQNILYRNCIFNTFSPIFQHI